MMMMANTQPKGVVMRMPRLPAISLQSYHTEYWPQINDEIRKILESPEEQVQQEELYRMIYNTCCQRHHATLYHDLMGLVRDHLSRMRHQLLNTTEQNFFDLFAQAFLRYWRSIDVLCVGFRYLERSYLLPQVGSTLAKILQDAYINTVLNPPNEPPEINRRLQITLQHFRPPIQDPATMMHLIKGLVVIKKELALFNMGLFAMYVPCLQPSTSLEEGLHETQSHLRSLAEAGVPPGNDHLKRKYDAMESQ